MTIKLYNRSGIPDEPLRSLLVSAGKLMGCHGSVVVKATRGGLFTKSCVYGAIGVNLHHLDPRTKKDKQGRPTPSYPITWIPTNGGWVELKVKEYQGADPLQSAEVMFKTMLHEFDHIRGHQVGEEFSRARPGHQRRTIWKYRIEERRAESRVDETLRRIQNDRKEIDELILQIGVQLEDAAKRRDAVWNRKYELPQERGAESGTETVQ